MANINLRSFLDNAVGSHSYYEFTILNSLANKDGMSARVCSYDTNLQDGVFHELLNRLGRKGAVKQYKESVVGDIHYLNFDNKEVNIIQKTYEHCQEFHGKFVCLSGNKKKLNILSYPSTYDSDYEALYKVYQVKINHRIHVRFIQERSVDNPQKSYTIIVSYTHDEKVEKKHNIDELVKTIGTLIQ